MAALNIRSRSDQDKDNQRIAYKIMDNHVVLIFSLRRLCPHHILTYTTKEVTSNGHLRTLNRSSMSSYSHQRLPPFKANIQRPNSSTVLSQTLISTNSKDHQRRRKIRRHKISRGRTDQPRKVSETQTTKVSSLMAISNAFPI